MPSRKTPLQFLSFFVPAVVLVGGMTALTARPSAESVNVTEAARLNSIGVALMNQQLTEKASAQFAEAEKADPQSAIPVLNRGISLLYLEKLPEAEQELQQAARMTPDNPRVWYNLGLTQMDEANQKQAIDDMRKVLALDPKDADAHYFVGQLDLTLGNFTDAIAEFEKALELNPIHCSAQFGLARALQRVGRTQEAHEHLKTFQHLTQAKIASPLSVGYGERGRYSTMEERHMPEAPVGAMIPVRFEAQRVMQFAPSRYRQGARASQEANSPGGGACVLDMEAAGSQDLVVMTPGPQAIQAYRNLKNGSFEPIPASQTGLDASGEGIACAVGELRQRRPTGSGRTP